MDHGDHGAAAPPVRVSHVRLARLSGLAYLVIIASGVFAEFFVRQALIVPGDPGATAANILRAEATYRTAIGSEFIMLGADVFLAGALYVIFAPAGRLLALLAAFFRLIHAAVVGANLLNMFFPLLLLGERGPLGSEGADALGLVFLEAQSVGYTVGLVFFGFGCLALGAVVYRSRMVPRLLGALLGLAGCGYLVDGFSRAVLVDYPAVQPLLEVVVFAPALVAELSFALWLVGKGVTHAGAGVGGTPTGGPAEGH